MNLPTVGSFQSKCMFRTEPVRAQDRDGGGRVVGVGQRHGAGVAVAVAGRVVLFADVDGLAVLDRGGHFELLDAEGHAADGTHAHLRAAGQDTLGSRRQGCRSAQARRRDDDEQRYELLHTSSFLWRPTTEELGRTFFRSAVATVARSTSERAPCCVGRPTKSGDPAARIWTPTDLHFGAVLSSAGLAVAGRSPVAALSSPRTMGGEASAGPRGRARSQPRRRSGARATHKSPPRPWFPASSFTA